MGAIKRLFTYAIIAAMPFLFAKNLYANKINTDTSITLNMQKGTSKKQDGPRKNSYAGQGLGIESKLEAEFLSKENTSLSTILQLDGLFGQNITTKDSSGNEIGNDKISSYDAELMLAYVNKIDKNKALKLGLGPALSITKANLS